MSIATVKAVINGQTYPLTLAEDGYYTLSGTAPALSSANEPGGYYGVQIIATDEAGNETTINQEDGTWGEQLRLVAYESVKPTATSPTHQRTAGSIPAPRPLPPSYGITIVALIPPPLTCVLTAAARSHRARRGLR